MIERLDASQTAEDPSLIISLKTELIHISKAIEEIVEMDRQMPSDFISDE